MTREFTSGVLVLVISIATTSAQSASQAPVRDQSRVSSLGSAAISGTVVSDDEARAPMRRVVVTLVRSGTEDMRTASTDEAGRFHFALVPTGSYTVGFARGGFIATSYGAPRAGVPGREIALAEGQTLELKPTALSKGAAIGGRVIDSSGRPVQSVRVQAAQFVSVGGMAASRSGSGAAGSATTNAHGEYRIFGLLPGQYFVHSEVPQQALPPSVTAAELRWAADPSLPPPPTARPSGFTPTLYPGGVDIASATPIVLGKGEERQGIDIALQIVPIAKLSGVVIGLDGKPSAGAQVWRLPKRMTPFTRFMIVSVRTNQAGAFVFTENPPGDFVLQARAGAGSTPVILGIDRQPITPPNPVPASWGEADVSIAGRDITDVSIALQPGLTVSGRVVVQGSAAPLISAGAVRLQILTASNVPAPPGTTSATVNADGTFMFEGVVPGSYRIGAAIPQAQGSPWMLRSATHLGRDLVDVPVDIGPGRSVSDLVVVIGDVQSQVSGTLTDAAGQPAPELNVFVFSTDKAHWHSGSRRVKTVRASETGSYVITGLAAGEYYLCALAEVDRQLMYEPEYLQQLPMSIKLTLADGEKKTQNLRVGG